MESDWVEPHREREARRRYAPPPLYGVFSKKIFSDFGKLIPQEKT